MTRWIGVGLAAVLALAPCVASAQSAGGHAALALAAIVGTYSPRLTAAQKAVLAHYLASKPNLDAHAPSIQVNSASITCGASDVDITRFFCDMKIGTAPSIHLTGRAANELYATLGDAGVQDDGAAGAIYRAITVLHCVLIPSDIANEGGAGATCTYTPA
ncbi:MAG TPA: hypothetical protein VHW60_24810 [Caulobacteraceae bacterium]|jgi:hypothetical protein|nr:hypothetical protein [Caulobacteraceae bacterium]